MAALAALPGLGTGVDAGIAVDVGAGGCAADSRPAHGVMGISRAAGWHPRVASHFSAAGFSFPCLGGAVHNSAGRHHHRHHAPAVSQRIAGNGRIQADFRNQVVRLSGHPGNAYHQEAPRQDVDTGGHGGQGGQDELEKQDVEHHHGDHGRIGADEAHTDVLGSFAAAHSEAHRAQQRQHRHHHIPFCDLEKQLDELKAENKADDDNQQPTRAYAGKIASVREGEGDAGGNPHQVDHLFSDREADVADVPGKDEQGAEQGRTEYQHRRGLGFKAEPGKHGFHGLEGAVADQQAPADSDKDLVEGGDNRHAGFPKGEVGCHDSQQGIGAVSDQIQKQPVDPFAQAL